MDVEEARRLLEVGRDVDRSTLRRAYMRAVKRHSPERDPEGFKRVREAFELLEKRAAWMPAARTAESPPVVAPVEPAPAEATAAGDDGAVLADEPDHVSEIEELLDAAPDDDARIEILREAIARAPADAGLRYQLYYLLLDLGRTDEAVAVLRRARDEVSPAFGDLVILDHAELATPDELDAFAASGAPQAVADVALARLAQGEVERGARDLAAAYETAAQSPTAPAPSSYRTLRVVLELHRDGHVRHARTVWAAFREWIQATGAERALIGGQATSYAFARALAELPDNFPSEARSAIARGALSANLDEAGAELEAFARADPLGGFRAAEALERSSRPLAALFVPHLRVRGERPGTSAQPWPLGCVTVIGVIIAIRAIASLGGMGADHVIDARRRIPWRAEVTPRTGAPVAPEDAICRRVGSSTATCNDALALAEAIRQGDCHAAHAAYSRLVDTPAEQVPEAMYVSTEFRSLFDDLWNECGMPRGARGNGR